MVDGSFNSVSHGRSLIQSTSSNIPKVIHSEENLNKMKPAKKTPIYQEINRPQQLEIL
jgi:hypothetical protein